MFLSSIEARRRVKAFDAIVEQTDHALRHPEVIAQLGDTATKLIDMNSRVFLPDLRHGELIVPPSQLATPNPALFPANQAQLMDNGKLLNQIEEQLVFSWKPAGKTIDAPPYDISMDVDTIRKYYFDEVEPEIQEDVVTPTRTTKRRAVTGNRSVMTAKGNFLSSRPVIRVANIIAKAGRARCAGISAHELTHAGDVIAFDPIFINDFTNAAGETRAYHVQTVIDSAHGGSEGTEDLNRIEALRRSEVDPMRPFHPTQAIVDMMRAEGRI